jgi:hypothetical protein
MWNCPCGLHEVTCGTGGIAPLILNLGSSRSGQLCDPAPWEAAPEDRMRPGCSWVGLDILEEEKYFRRLLEFEAL